MEAFLQELIPRIHPDCDIRLFQGKEDLMANLRKRLRAYGAWLPRDWRIIVMVDRDNSDCHALKAQLEMAAASSHLRTRSGGVCWQVVNRDRGTGGMVFRRLGRRAERLSKSFPHDPDESRIPEPGQDTRRDMGSIRARSSNLRVFQRRATQNRGCARHRPTRRSTTQPVAQFRSVSRCARRSDRLNVLVSARPKTFGQDAAAAEPAFNLEAKDEIAGRPAVLPFPLMNG